MKIAATGLRRGRAHWRYERALAWLGSLKQAPKTLWVNGVVSVIWALVAIAVTRPFLLLGLFTLAVSIGFSILLLRGSRVIWVLIVAGSVLTFAFAPFEGVHWWTIPATILDLGLLLAPSSRRYVWRARPRSLPQTGQSSMDPQSTPDSERPKGW